MSGTDNVISNRVLLKHAGFLQKAKLLLNADPDQETAEGAESSAVASESWSDAGDELLGIGARPKALTETGQTDRHILSSNEKLRKQLLGRSKGGHDYRPKNKHAHIKSMPRKLDKTRGAISDDEEESRSKGTNRTKYSVAQSGTGMLGTSRTTASESLSAQQSPLHGRKRPASYLDQVLASRNKKKRQNTTKDNG